MSGMTSGAPRPARVDEHAAGNLRYIRDAMERASDFTAVPGWGGVLMGITAVGAALLAHRMEDKSWLAAWLGEAAIGLAIGLFAIARKARRAGTPLGGAAARRFALAFVPAIAAGATFTALFANAGAYGWLPGCWLLLYGTAVTSGG